MTLLRKLALYSTPKQRRYMHWAGNQGMVSSSLAEERSPEQRYHEALERYRMRLRETKPTPSEFGVSDLSLRDNQVHQETKAEIPDLTHEPVRFMAHDHHAEKAGRHFDMRMNLNGKAYSWATKQGFPKAPSDHGVYWFRQPDHTVEYMDWTGTIPKGEYGAGEVGKAFDTEAVVSTSPKKIELSVHSGEHKGRYALVHVGGPAWKVFKRPDLEYHHSERRSYPLTVPEHMWTDPNVIASEKLDGANMIIRVNPTGLGIVSQRMSVSGGLIPREDQVPHIRDIKAPKEFHGMVLRGELYHPTEPFNILSGILNSGPIKAIKAQKALGKVHLGVFDVEKLPGGLSADGVPYGERMALLDRFTKAIDNPSVIVPKTSKENKREFYQEIVAKGGEGVILTDARAVDKPGEPHVMHKLKASEDWSLKVTGFTPHSKRPDEIGAITVEDASGKFKANVGTGLSQEQRRDMAKNPEHYMNKVIRVRGMGLTGNSIRAPVFGGFEDKDKPDTLTKESWFFQKSPEARYQDALGRWKSKERDTRPSPSDFGVQSPDRPHVHAGPSVTNTNPVTQFPGPMQDTWGPPTPKQVPLLPQQGSAVDFIVSHGGSGILAHVTGAGKTRSGIEAAQALRKKGMAGKVLAITPAALRTNFAVEGLKRFTTEPFTILGGHGERGPGFSHPSNPDPKANYYVVSYDVFRNDPEGIIKRTGANTLIMDEFHRIKDPSGGTFKAVMKARPLVKNVIGLTGSLISTHPNNILQPIRAVAGRSPWNEQEFEDKFLRRVDPDLDRPKRGIFGALLQARDRKPVDWMSFFGRAAKPQKKGEIIGWKNEAELQQELSKYIHYVGPEHVAGQMPKKNVETVRVEMSPLQEQVYRAALREIDPITLRGVETGQPMNEEDEAKVFNRLVKARQAANSVHLFTGMPLKEAAQQTPKIQKLMDTVEDHLAQNKDGQVVIYTNLVNAGVDIVRAALKDRGIKHGVFIGKGQEIDEDKKIRESEVLRQQDVQDFKDGKLKTIVLSGAGSEGISFPNATALYSIDSHFNPERILQAEARAVRSGGQQHRAPEDRKVDVKRFLTVYPEHKSWFNLPFHAYFKNQHDSDSVDEWVLDRAERRHQVNQRLFDVLQGRAQGPHSLFDPKSPLRPERNSGWFGKTSGHPTAVIITGNPKFIHGNPKADKFYKDIQHHLQSQGYHTRFDPGEPHTSPPKADLWVGHSRGVDRLRFAPTTTKTVALGSSHPKAINHPGDNTKDFHGPSDVIPNEHHYALTDEMKAALTKTSGIIHQLIEPPKVKSEEELWPIKPGPKGINNYAQKAVDELQWKSAVFWDNAESTLEKDAFARGEILSTVVNTGHLGDHVLHAKRQLRDMFPGLTEPETQSHVTLIYAHGLRNADHPELLGKIRNHLANRKLEFSVGQPIVLNNRDRSAIVLKVEGQDLHNAHNELKATARQHGAYFNPRPYNPHVTLFYREKPFTAEEIQKVKSIRLPGMELHKERQHIDVTMRQKGHWKKLAHEELDEYLGIQYHSLACGLVKAALELYEEPPQEPIDKIGIRLPVDGYSKTQKLAFLVEELLQKMPEITSTSTGLFGTTMLVEASLRQAYDPDKIYAKVGEILRSGIISEEENPGDLNVFKAAETVIMDLPIKRWVEPKNQDPACQMANTVRPERTHVEIPYGTEPHHQPGL